MEKKNVCVPGQRLSQLDERHVGGPGTYIRDGYIYSSLAGTLEMTKAPQGKICVEVQSSANHSVVPQVGTLVTCRVKNVNPRFCKVDIICVEQTILQEPFRGMIRREDVRATEKDKIEMAKSYRSGDIVIARVISLGDSQSYLLSTGENELGVVIAVSEEGGTMVPISWEKMQCPISLTVEHRKVAKVQPQHIEMAKVAR